MRYKNQVVILALNSKIYSDNSEEAKLLTFQQGLYIRPNGNIFWLHEKVDILQKVHLQFQHALYSLSNGLLLDQFSDLLQSPTTPLADKEQ